MARFSADGQDYTRALALGTQAALTVSCWFKLAVDRNDYSSIFFVDNGTSDNWGMQTGADGTTMATVFDASTQEGMGSLTVGVWYYVCLATSGTTGNLYWKKLGDPSLTVVAVTSVTASVNAATLRIGESPWGAEWFNGSINAVKLWNHPHTRAEAELESTQYAPQHPANLLAYYPLHRPDPLDYSGNGRTLTGSGATYEDGPPIPLQRIVVRPWLLTAPAGGGAVALEGTAPAAASASGALDTDRALAGNASSASSATGTTDVARALEGAAPASASASGSLSTDRPLAGTAAAASSATAAADVARPLAGAANAANSASGALDTTRPLAGTAAAASSATGDLTISGQVTLEGAAPASASASGSLSTDRPLAGTAAAAGSATAAADVARPLAGTASTAAHLTGTAAIARGLNGSSAAAAALTGEASVARLLAGAAAAASSATGTLTVTGPSSEPQMVVTAGRLTTGRTAGGIVSGWSAGPVRSGWSAELS